MLTSVARMAAAVVVAEAVWCGCAAAGQTWVCAVASAVAVDEDGTVGPPELGDRERPTFFRVDPLKKQLTLLAPKSRRGEVTKLDTVTEVEGLTVCSGVENGRGVSLIISAEGRLTLSVISDGVVWSVFGHALPETEVQPPQN
ncbi:MAG: hypothetical protein EBR86_13965 [Planctomycetia bacterium]|nr:hypothetical protein [Planctomycetia bacterium]